MEHSSALAHEAETLIAILVKGTRICRSEFYSKYETMGLRNPLPSTDKLVQDVSFVVFSEGPSFIEGASVCLNQIRKGQSHTLA